MNEYYTYAFLRKDGTPYYIGKGKGRRIRAKSRCGCNAPKDKSRVIYLKQNLTEEEAFKHEIYMISVYGRKDLGTGILRNRTDGGDGCNRVITDETRKRMSESQSGKKLTNKHKSNISKRVKGLSRTDESKQKYSVVAKKRWENKNDLRRDKLIERNKSYKGMLFWNDGQTQIRSVECPGINWKRGRLKKSGI